jgi:hypothetical protein
MTSGSLVGDIMWGCKVAVLTGIKISAVKNGYYPAG